VLATGLQVGSAAQLDRQVTGAPTLPPGVVVTDPNPVTVWQVERGLPAREIEQAPANAVVVRPDALLAGSVAVTGVAAGCCGLDGQDGPNQACATCGQPLGTAWTDCWTQHEVRFDPDAVLLAE
jgi:hypothetical protein